MYWVDARLYLFTKLRVAQGGVFDSVCDIGISDFSKVGMVCRGKTGRAGSFGGDSSRLAGICGPGLGFDAYSDVTGMGRSEATSSALDDVCDPAM
jgi:hypothetical protein